jgi:rSAM/selenodomain-associated transferase 2
VPTSVLAGATGMRPAAKVTVSVVIPILNAANTLAATLADVATADEIVVVDADSTDGSAELARSLGAKVLRAPRGRGAQLHCGACEATGEWLLFLHADTRLSIDWRAAVEAFTAIPDAAHRAAAFRFALDDRDWQARLIERLVAARVRLFALPYGDQGLLIHRDLYRAVGGFRPLPLMEDVDLVRRLGPRRLARLNGTARTSACRWRKDGWFARSARNVACLALYGMGAPIDRIAKFYGR